MEPITLTLAWEPVWFLWGFLALSYIPVAILVRHLYRRNVPHDEDTAALVFLFLIAPVTMIGFLVYGVGWLLLKLLFLGCEVGARNHEDHLAVFVGAKVIVITADAVSLSLQAITERHRQLNQN